MLQIASKMYFRPEVKLYETTHRDVFYTNALLPTRELALPTGRLLPSSTLSFWMNSMTVEASEALEAVLEDGSESVHIATGGSELIDDLADVFVWLQPDLHPVGRSRSTAHRPSRTAAARRLRGWPLSPDIRPRRLD